MHGANPRRSGRVHRVLLAALGAAATLFVPAQSWADTQAEVRAVKVMAALEGGTTQVELSTTGTPVYSLRVEGNGLRLVLDLQNAAPDATIGAITESKGLVGGILTREFKTDDGKSMTRLSVTLLKQAYYRVTSSQGSLKLDLAPADKTGPAGPAVKFAPVQQDAAPAATELTEVRFDRAAKCSTGCDRIVLKLSRVPAYAFGVSKDGKPRLELKKVRASALTQNTLDVSAQNSVLRRVTANYDKDADAVIVEVDRQGDGSGTLSVEGDSLVWAFEAPKVAVASAGATRKIVTVAREQAHADMPKVETSIHGDKAQEPKIETSVATAEAGFLSTVQAQAAGGAGRYNGRRIELDLKDADIHNILRLLADVGKVNIITADDVAGSVTIRMRNVPWDQALDVVLQAKNLGMVRSGNLIRVAPLAALQKERELRLAAAKQEYELTPLETRLIPVSYAHADELQARAKDLLSPRGSLAVDERTNVLIARDIAGNLNNVEELVRSLDTQTPQVLIEARIVEATSRYQRDVGIQWGGDTTFSEATGNPTGLAFPSRITSAGGATDGQTPTQGLSPVSNTTTTPNFAVNLPAAVGSGRGGAIGFALGSLNDNFNLNLRLSAAEASGLVRIVSSPRILTLDNRDARINQGTLIPFAQTSAQGVQTTFQEAKLQLLVKPHVTADGAVSMHVKINRDEPDFNQTSARGDPTILKREAETDLLVLDGHTAVIGGIFTRNTGRNVDQVPFFGDIPILGILFQRRRASDTRNELVIFLTPRIVNRAEALGR